MPEAKSADQLHQASGQRPPIEQRSFSCLTAARRPESSSRDEMNLAEFPLAALSTRVDPSVKTLEFRDSVKLPTGEVIERKWIITGADKFGLPTATDDDVVLGLIRLSMDKGFGDRKIFFTRYELLKILRWSTEGRSYTRLIKSLDRLSGVRLRSTNSFYDNATKTYQTCNFGIIDAYEINSERPGKDGGGEIPKSYFVWSEVLFDSFKAGFIKKLDLDLYFTLKSSVSRRLYRYLDKHFYYRSSIEMPLMMLAFEKVGLSRTYKYVSSIKQQLEPAAKELVEAGFLSAYDFSGRGEQTMVRFTSAKSAAALTEASAAGKPAASAARRPETPEERLAQELIKRGIAEPQARRLAQNRSAAEMQKIAAILKYYDHLNATNDRRISKNAVGFLYRAVEAPYKFIVPNQFQDAEAAGAKRSAGRPELKVFKASRLSPVNSGDAAQRASAQSCNGRAINGQASDSEASSAQGMLEREYRTFCNREVTRVLGQMGEEERSALRGVVQHRMNALRDVLDSKRFEQVVESALHEEVRKLFGIPDFSSWLMQFHCAGAGRAAKQLV